MARARNPDKNNQKKTTMYIYKSLLRDLKLTHAEFCMNEDEHKKTYTAFVNEVLERGVSDYIISRRGDNGCDVS